MKRLPLWCFIAIALCSAVLSLARLDNAAFWDDEAHVSIIARNFLHSGQLTGWDGRNLIGYRNGDFLDEKLRTRNPPLDCLVTAASFALLGESTWAGRFPFVLLGWACLGAFFLLLRHDFPRVEVQVFAFGALGLSVAFLLMIRTVRYFSPALLFSVLIFYAYRRHLETRRLRDLLGAALAAALLFYSNYLLCAAFLIALGAMHLLWRRRDYRARDWCSVGVSITLLMLLTVPYVVIYRAWSYPALQNPDSWFARKSTVLGWNLRDWNLMNVLPLFFAIGLAYLAAQRKSAIHAAETARNGAHEAARNDTPEAVLDRRVLRAAGEWATLASVYIVVLALLSPQPPVIPPIADTRYLLPAVPFLAGLSGVFLALVWQRSRSVAGVLFALFLSCNVFGLSPWNPDFRWLLPAYVGELSRPYPTPGSEVSQWLRLHARQDDVVFGYPEHMNLPPMFYVGDKIRFGCLLSRRTHLPLATVRRLRAPLLREEHFPDWFIAFSFSPYVKTSLRYFQRPHRSGARMMRFPYHRVATLNLYWDQRQRPELPLHWFSPAKGFDPQLHAIYIFGRGQALPVSSALKNAKSPRDQVPRGD